MATRPKTPTEPPARKKCSRNPGLRTKERADAIVEGISCGIPLAQLCREHGISVSYLYAWRDDDRAFEVRIAGARAKGFDALAEQCLEIAEDASADYIETEHGPRLNVEHVQRSKLRIETRLKLLAKWDPKRYGDKVEHAVTGADGGPIQTNATVTLTAEEAYKMMLGGK